MAYEYLILENGHHHPKLPVEGKWYVGFFYSEEAQQYVDGEIAEYIGYGEFADENGEVDMRNYDYLVEQS